MNIELDEVVGLDFSDDALELAAGGAQGGLQGGLHRAGCNLAIGTWGVSSCY